MTSVKTAAQSDSWPTDELHLQMLIGLLFNRIHADLGVNPDEGWHGLRKSHLRVMEGVPVHGTSVTELGERIGLTKQGTGQLVTQLVESGHLVVDTDPSDARVRLVRRTTMGERVMTDFREAVEGVEACFAQQVGDRRYRTFRRVLEELALG